MYSNIQRNINLKEIRRICECVEPLISSFARGGHYGWGFPYHKQCFVDVLRIKNWGPPTITVMMMMMKENNTSRGNYISQKKDVTFLLVLCWSVNLSFSILEVFHGQGRWPRHEETPDTECCFFAFWPMFHEPYRINQHQHKAHFNTQQKEEGTWSWSCDEALLLAGNRFSVEKVCHYSTSTCAIWPDKKVTLGWGKKCHRLMADRAKC